MKLSNYIIDMGRVVAYYPNLKKITGSTTATIFLCQLIYWSSRTKTEWVYKVSTEIEEETGLTYYEQKAAKRQLKRKGLIEFQVKKLSHITRYRIKFDALNSMWEEYSGTKSEVVRKQETKETSASKVEPPAQVVSPPPGDFDPDHPEEYFKNRPMPPQTVRKDVQKKSTDPVLGYIELNRIGAVKENKINAIRELYEKKFHINTDSKKWNEFINFVYNRQENHAEKAEVFVKWALENGFNPIYWTPEKMRTMYPQAYVNKVEEQTANFIEPLPPLPDENKVIAPLHRRHRNTDIEE